MPKRIPRPTEPIRSLYDPQMDDVVYNLKNLSTQLPTPRYLLYRDFIKLKFSLIQIRAKVDEALLYHELVNDFMQNHTTADLEERPNT